MSLPISAELRTGFYFISSFPFLFAFDVWGPAAQVLSFACSSPVGGMLFGVSGLLLLGIIIHTAI